MDWGGGGSNGRVEENQDLRPLDEWGNERSNDNNRGSGNNGGNWGNWRNGGGGGGDGSWLKVIIAVAIIGVLLFVMFGNGGSTWTSIKRTFSNTPMENLNGMFNSVQEIETVNKKKGKFDDVYDKKALIGEEVALSQPNKEYLIYVYTKDEKLDKPFNEFVAKYQKDIPIYKINYTSLRNNIELTIYTASDYKPYLISVVDYGKGAKLVDAVIENEKQLDNVPDYFKAVVAENNFKKSEIHKDKND